MTSAELRPVANLKYEPDLQALKVLNWGELWIEE